MKIVILVALVFFRAETLLADADDVNLLRESLQKVKPPTPEQILAAGLVLGEQSRIIMEQKKNGDCEQREAGQEGRKNPISTEKPQCVICALVSEKDENAYQLVVATVEKPKDKERSKFDPEETYYSIEGLNDQPFHGLFEQVRPTGNDIDGHTYGSKVNVTGVYKWGEVTLDLGTDLYVLPYTSVINGKTYYEFTDEEGDSARILQEADEHSFARVGAKIYLKEKGNIEKGEKMHSPYMRFGLGIEHDSDQGIGTAGGIAQRESWHKYFDVTENVYINHMKDRTVATASAHLGLESYKPMGKFGLCSLVESGVSASSNGTVSLEAKVRASIDSGTFGGFSRKAPLLLLNVEAGIHRPVAVGKGPTVESDPQYAGQLENRNYRMIGDLVTTFTSVGTEIGGERFRMNIEAIYEKYKWNDGDIIYRTGVKWKY
jgi:hypothetical protein